MRKKIRHKIYPELIDTNHLSSEFWWKRWLLESKSGFFFWDEPDGKGRYINGDFSFNFERSKKYYKLIERIKKEGKVVFGNDLKRGKINEN